MNDTIGRAKVCMLDGCGKAVRGRRSYCSMHESRMKRYGSFDDPRHQTTLRGRYERVALDDNGCLIWLDGVDSNGYGILSTGKWTKLPAHRWFYTHLVGAIPEGYSLRHFCGVNACVNPEHMDMGLGTHIPVPLEQQFWERVSDDGECWPWLGSLNICGYGTLSNGTGRPKVLAHRYAYELLVGPIPDGLTIDHLCRVKHCVNPGHMEVVTRSVNSSRGAIDYWRDRRSA